MALSPRSINRTRIPSLLLCVTALVFSLGCETGYLVEGLPVCDPFGQPEQPDAAAAATVFGMAHFAPNPFVETTMLHFVLPRTGRLVVEVYDSSGRRVEALANGDLPYGEHALSWSAANRAERLAAGVYFVRVAFGTEVFTQKLVLIRR